MLETIRYTGQRAFEEGLTGIEIMGEVSPASPPNELYYLAFEVLLASDAKHGRFRRDAAGEILRRQRACTAVCLGGQLG